MAVEVKECLYIQNVMNPCDKTINTECILPGDTVEMVIYRKGKIAITCVVKQFDKGEVKIWDITRDEDTILKIEDIESFKVLLRGWRSHAMFGDGDNPWDKVIGSYNKI